MAGFDRYNNILNLFTRHESSWTVAGISEYLDVPASTIYRNVRELVSKGFLESATGSYFRLGPAFIEFDRTIQLTDPLIRSGDEFLNQLVNHTPIPCVAILARLYGNKVMCVADARSNSFQRDTSYQRGHPMPIDKGATSLAILSQLEASKVKRLVSQEYNNDDDTTDIMKTLSQVRKYKLSVTHGEVDKDLVGYAVPLSNKQLGITASLSCIFVASEFSSDHEPKVFALLSNQAHLIENLMQKLFDDLTEVHDTDQT